MNASVFGADADDLTSKTRLTNEFQLVAACCRWPLDDITLAAIREAGAGAGIDFGRVMRIADRHRVQGLVDNALRAAEVALPAEIDRRFAARAKVIALRGLAMAAEASRIAQLAARAGIDIVILKGAPLAYLAYGIVSLKHASDIDLAVAPVDLIRARAMLASAGYEAKSAVVAKDEPWINSDRRILIELHTDLVDHPAWLSGAGVAAPRHTVAIGEAYAVPTLDCDRLFAYLCVQGAAHGWSRLKWLADFSALVSQLPASELTRRHARSVEWGAGRCVGQALILSADLFGTDLEPELEARLRQDQVLGWLVANAYRSFSGRNEVEELDARALSTVRIHISQLVFTQGWRSRGALLASKLRARQPGDGAGAVPIGPWPVEAGRWLKGRFQRTAALRASVVRADVPAIDEKQ